MSNCNAGTANESLASPTTAHPVAAKTAHNRFDPIFCIAIPPIIYEEMSNYKTTGKWSPLHIIPHP